MALLAYHPTPQILRIRRIFEQCHGSACLPPLPPNSSNSKNFRALSWLCRALPTSPPKFFEFEEFSSYVMALPGSPPHPPKYFEFEEFSSIASNSKNCRALLWLCLPPLPSMAQSASPPSPLIRIDDFSSIIIAQASPHPLPPSDSNSKYFRALSCRVLICHGLALPAPPTPQMNRVRRILEVYHSTVCLPNHRKHREHK